MECQGDKDTPYFFYCFWENGMCVQDLGEIGIITN
jgi:hypothetical protein